MKIRAEPGYGSSFTLKARKLTLDIGKNVFQKITAYLLIWKCSLRLAN